MGQWLKGLKRQTDHISQDLRDIMELLLSPVYMGEFLLLIIIIMDRRIKAMEIISLRLELEAKTMSALKPKGVL